MTFFRLLDEETMKHHVLAPAKANNKQSFQPITKQPFFQKVPTLRQYLLPPPRSNWLSLKSHNVIPKRWVRYDSSNATAKLGHLFHGRHQIFVGFLIAILRGFSLDQPKRNCALCLKEWTASQFRGFCLYFVCILP